MDPKTLRYAKTHEWAALNGDIVTVGVSQFAVDLLTDITHVELPKVGRSVTAGAACGEIESVKAVSDLYAPVEGTVAAVNSDAAANPGLVTAEPYGQGWLFKITVKPGTKLDHLLDLKQYEDHVTHEAH
jgi:glycine cleavage system H protein